jgi:hypothetical protein
MQLIENGDGIVSDPSARTGISMIDEPVPTMPEMVPATRPTMRTKRRFKGCNSETDGDGENLKL